MKFCDEIIQKHLLNGRKTENSDYVPKQTKYPENIEI